MGPGAGTTNFTRTVDVPTVAQEGIFTVGVRVTDTEEDLISDNSFDLTVVSGASLLQKNIPKG